MKFDFKSALMGACLVFGLFGLNSFRSPMPECLTQEQEDVLALLSVVQLYGCDDAYQPTLRLTGANFQIVNGVGYTDSVNGTGNLIVGYNASCDGSHNIVVGDGNEYHQYSGIVGGESNTVIGPDAVVVGGQGHNANNLFSVIVGGVYNTNNGDSATITGGRGNSAGIYAQYGVVSGGNTRSVTGVDDWAAGTLFEDN